ncbi:MAG TPA: YtxH domain-containing protein [Acidimicrobiales bacterium]
MRFRTGVIIGAAVGYYYGAKAGRERYEQIDAVLDRIRSRPQYQQARDRALDGLGGVSRVAKDRATAALDSAVSAVLPSEPEPSYEPGLEFNPDFSPSTEEILADLRGDAPAG